MPTPRENRPYMQFNFQVQIDNRDVGGFQEISGIGTEVAVTEYRHGNDKDNNVRKLSGLNKAADVTLKRGILGTTALFEWIDEVRTGKASALKSVSIQLYSEDRSNDQPVMTWNLKNARALKLTYGPLNAKGNDVAMEELVLAYERLELS
ncbi:phage tail protein [Chitinivorax sp. PXF-14]|uniref:phage tail protein n=1 Tax=Chitinivorax sp. PXF-14 TaxID=3230488 RepID=UPI003465F716